MGENYVFGSAVPPVAAYANERCRFVHPISTPLGTPDEFLNLCCAASRAKIFTFCDEVETMSCSDHYFNIFCSAAAEFYADYAIVKGADYFGTIDEFYTFVLQAARFKTVNWLERKEDAASVQLRGLFSELVVEEDWDKVEDWNETGQHPLTRHREKYSHPATIIAAKKLLPSGLFSKYYADVKFNMLPHNLPSGTRISRYTEIHKEELMNNRPSNDFFF